MKRGERQDIGCVHWDLASKFDPAACALADRHYSRRKVGSPQFMPPGQTVVLVLPDNLAVFGWWRPHPTSGLRAMNGLDGWTCTIFRNEGRRLSSELLLDAERALYHLDLGCGPSGLITYVWDAKVRSRNPGYCFKAAGWHTAGRSADGKKSLLLKPWPFGQPMNTAAAAGLSPSNPAGLAQTTAASGAGPHGAPADSVHAQAPAASKPSGI